jgi:hypothetical protein
MTDLLLVGGLLAGVFLASYVVEGLRSPPDRPDRLSWDPKIPVRFVTPHPPSPPETLP